MEKWKQTQEIFGEIFTQKIFGDIFAQELIGDIFPQEIFGDIFAQEIRLFLQPNFLDGVVQQPCLFLNWNNNVPAKSNYT